MVLLCNAFESVLDWTFCMEFKEILHALRSPHKHLKNNLKSSYLIQITVKELEAYWVCASIVFILKFIVILLSCDLPLSQAFHDTSLLFHNSCQELITYMYWTASIKFFPFGNSRVPFSQSTFLSRCKIFYKYWNKA